MPARAVASFAQEHAREVTRHAFRQFLADRSLAAAQHAAKSAGMPIGLIADLAVGVDSGGSQCWARPDETLLGLSIGASAGSAEHPGARAGASSPIRRAGCG